MNANNIEFDSLDEGYEAGEFALYHAGADSAYECHHGNGASCAIC